MQVETVSGVRLYRLGMPLAHAPRCRVAVVGTRDPTPLGVAATREVARLLVARNCAIVTGLARGVDAVAAETAAETGGFVIAVLPYLYRPRLPVTTVVSEHVDRRMIRQRLAARNRVIALLSQAVIVPETRYRPRGWGTRYAVEHAVGLGRPAYVLRPRTQEQDVWEGYKRLIQLGAKPAETPEETVEMLFCAQGEK